MPNSCQLKAPFPRPMLTPGLLDFCGMRTCMKTISTASVLLCLWVHHQTIHPIFLNAFLIISQSNWFVSKSLFQCSAVYADKPTPLRLATDLSWRQPTFYTTMTTRTLPLIFLHDFTLFVIDMQNRSISLFSTPFDHFHFHALAALIWWVLLRSCHMSCIVL